MMAVILLVVLASIIYLRLSRKTPTSSEITANQESLKDLLMTPNQMCTFRINDADAGTLYAAKSNFRIDFTKGENGKTTSRAHMISDLVNVFVWFDDNKIGIRVPWPIVLENSTLDAVAANILDLGIKVESECKPWRVESSKFELPDRDFKDFGKKIPGSIQNDISSPERKAQCAECQNLDPKEASECRTKLECH